MKTYVKGSAAEFGQRLSKALIDKNGGNQSELARAIKCSPQAVQKWVSGVQFPRDKTLRQLAEYLGVTPEWLRFGATGEQVPPQTPEFILAYIKVEEAELLTNYRELTEAGKRQFRVAAASAERLPTASLPKKSQQA